MNKKIIAVLAMLLGLGTASTFAVTGIGLQTGYTAGGYNSFPLTVTFKVQQLPCVFAVDAGLGSGLFSIGGTADWWIGNPKINVKGANGKWRWFYAAGIAANFTSYRHDIPDGYGRYKTANETYISVAPRAVIGTNYFLTGNWELYGQAAFQLPFMIGFGEYAEAFKVSWGVPVNVGFRYWF